VSVIDRQVYATKVPEAQRRIGHRDSNDVEILALALHMGVPLWSNDNDFEDAGVEWYTTAELLKKLGGTEREK
jgi:predicted nucleic acid-binding protein